MLVKPEIRFVLLSAARSGTTVTIDLLSQHPDAYVHKEIFNKKNSSNQIRKEFVTEIGLEDRLTDSIGFAKKVFNFSPGQKCVGFKMWRSQAPEASAYVLGNPSIHKIVHVRENTLASYSSQILAKATGVSHITDARAKKGAGNHKRPKINFDKDQFLNMCARRNRDIETIIKLAKGPVLRTTYAGTTSEGPAGIYEFLGLESFKASYRMQRVNSKNTIERFNVDQHEEIRAVLDEVGHPEWISE